MYEQPLRVTMSSEPWLSRAPLALLIRVANVNFAALSVEIGLTERYRIEGWRIGGKQKAQPRRSVGPKKTLPTSVTELGDDGRRSPASSSDGRAIQQDP